MNGKNVEKLVLSGRLITLTLILATLVYTTTPHSSLSRSSGDLTLDTLFATADFSVINVPIAGEVQGSKKSSQSAEEASQIPENNNKSADSSENSDEPNDNSKDAGDSDESNGNSGDSNENTTETPVTLPAENYPTPVYYSYVNNANSAAQAAQSTQQSAQPATQPKTSTIDYNKVIYTDDNGESIDSSTERGGVPAITPVPSADDGSTSDDPSEDLVP